MRTIPIEQVVKRIQAENVWWEPPHQIVQAYDTLPPRAYFDLFFPLVRETAVRRAVLLLGPRRVGKTVLLHQAVRRLIQEGVPPKHICYVSVDHPIYNECGLEELLDAYGQASGTDYKNTESFVFFDEIQYLRNWEIHLKSLVDSYRGLKATASGSAAAALRLKSAESGAGRFTEFLLPPLTFHEYLLLLGKTDLILPKVTPDKKSSSFEAADIELLNNSFVHYLNFGGYPEVIFSEQIQSDPARFIKSDIIDKVLLRDLPGLYGIQDIQELNYLFTTLAFNTADEVSLEALSRGSGVAKNTIKRYIEYLEAAFLIKTVHRIDRSAKRFQRANFFKVYLTNPSIRSALFSPISSDDESMGPLAETGIFAQWFHTPQPLHYARWQGGEVDIVYLDHQQKAAWAVEVKWTDRYFHSPHELRSLLSFCQANRIARVTVTTRSASGQRSVEGVEIKFTPASIYCYTVGRNVVRGKHGLGGLAGALEVSKRAGIGAQEPGS